MALETWEEFARKQLTRRMNKIIRKMHELTEQVERDAAKAEQVGNGVYKSYAGVARDVQHSVLWGLANLNLDGLVDAAFDADVARIRGDEEA